MTTPPTPADPVAVWWATDLAATLADGDPVASWVDGVNGHAAVQGTSANRPTWRATDMRGRRPTVDFDGVNDFLRYGGTLTTSESGCVVAVLRTPNTPSGFDYAWSSCDEATATHHYIAAGREDDWRQIWRNGPDTTGQSRWADGDAANNSFHVLESSSDGSAWTFRLDNVAMTLAITYDVPAPTTLASDGVWFGDVANRDSFAIGCLLRSSASSHWFGHIAYLGVFDSPLSSGDRADLYQWIRQYYGPGGFRLGKLGFGPSSGGFS